MTEDSVELVFCSNRVVIFKIGCPSVRAFSDLILILVRQIYELKIRYASFF